MGIKSNDFTALEYDLRYQTHRTPAVELHKTHITWNTKKASKSIKWLIREFKLRESPLSESREQTALRRFIIKLHNTIGKLFKENLFGN